MQMRRFGGSDEELSTLGFGAWVTGADTFITSLDEDALGQAIRAALDAGVTWIDTAEIYAGGLSEEIVGRVLTAAGEDLFVSTKVAPRDAGTGMRPEEIAQAIRASLRRLGRERVDLYLLHWHDPSIPLEDSWGAMTQLMDEGLARFIGVCNFDRRLVARCLTVGPVHAVQNQLSVLHRADAPAALGGSGLIGWLAERGIGYLAYGSLAFGLLSGAVTEATRFDEADWRSGHARWEGNYYEELFAAGRLEERVAFVRELSTLAGELEIPLTVFALRWVLEQPGVTALVMGSRSPAHIRANAAAGRVTLGSAVLARVDDLDRHGDRRQRIGEGPPG
jgi:aryl-alcohol dehydrogenase-like predicted oxidoreductase